MTMANRQRHVTSSTVKTADAANIASGPALIYWITASNSHATDNCAIEIQDGLTDTGDTVWGVDQEFGTSSHYGFNPPLPCSTGLTLDITGGTARVTIGFVSGKP